MTHRHAAPSALFNRVVLGHPVVIIVALLLATAFLAVKARHFRLDASAETLVLEDDEDLRYARRINERYGQSELLIITYTPSGDLFASASLDALRRLRDALRGLDRVSSVRTILDVPLIETAAATLESLKADLPTLDTPGTDRALAVQELRESPLYRDLLVSADSGTTALLVFLEADVEYEALLKRRRMLRGQVAAVGHSDALQRELKQVSQSMRVFRKNIARRRHQEIAAIRALMKQHAAGARVFLGGTGMIADDMITFIKTDLKVFGLGALAALMVTLGIVFRGLRWVCLPIICCGVSVITMLGLLGWLGWEVTVISANFISLQLIMTMALAIHIVVQYRQLLLAGPEEPNRQLILQAVRRKLKPCVFAILTTMAGFGSLLLCNILPVIMLGKIMIIGLAVSLIVVFLLLPAMLVLLPRATPPRNNARRGGLTTRLARFTEARGAAVFIISGLVFLLGGVGVARLEVENRFIDYFRADTEIHQGMTVIDQKLGGTTPLDVILGFGTRESESVSTSAASHDVTTEDEAIFDEFDLLEDAATADKYWFTEEKADLIRKAHGYLDNLPETGKVMSLATSLYVADRLTGNRSLDSFDLALLYSETPDEFKALLVEPYASVENNEARIHLRVRDSDKSLRRNVLLHKIRSDLPAALGVSGEDVRLTGLLVLYNNMLQSLFDAQILTLGFTMLLLSGMLLILFRSWRVTLLALLPNMLPVLLVLGVMGWLHIPLDMMTITIAAIGIGIAVDDTVHYVHRFREELSKDGQYLSAMHRSHESVGLAMYYTTATITAGFCILAMSNFIPTVSFGILTGLAMVAALIADLTLLPRLLIWIKPFGNSTAEPRPQIGRPSAANAAQHEGRQPA